MNNEKVILVDKNDSPLGEMEKMEAHIHGKLHRAFSVFIFNTKGEILVHQRADKKYHGGGLWSNACCSHPQLYENIEESAIKRLHYEMGLECDLRKLFTFTYKNQVENNLIEHEYDHVFIGFTDKNPNPNRNEVKDYMWIPTERLQANMVSNPKIYTSWFKMALPRVLIFLNEIR